MCYANLASLYNYRGEGEKARARIKRALELDPLNESYLGIKQDIEGM